MAFHFDRNVSLLGAFRPARVWLLSEINYTEAKTEAEIGFYSHLQDRHEDFKTRSVRRSTAQVQESMLETYHRRACTICS